VCLYKEICRRIISITLPEDAASYFTSDKEALMDYVFPKDPAAILCCEAMRTLVIRYFRTDKRFKK